MISDVMQMTKLFLNVSNHPSVNWAEEQLNAALQYGEIEDLPFPNVDELGDEVCIEKMADDLFSQIMEKCHGRECVVHLMGELTLTFAVLKKLQAVHVECVASTTKRIVTENSVGEKTVIFKFERFRKYMMEENES